MDKITKYLIGNRRESKKIFKWLSITSIALLVLSSEDKVFRFIPTGSFIEKILCLEILKNSIIYNLSLGMIVSGTFYYFVSHIPEKRRKERLKLLLKHKIQKLISRGENFLKNYYNISEKELGNLVKEKVINPGSMNDFDDNIKRAMEKKPNEDRSDRGKGLKTGVRIEGKLYFSTLGTELANLWFLGLDEFKDLEEYSQIYDDIDLTKIIQETNYIGLTDWIRSYAIAKNSNKNIINIKPNVDTFYLLVRELIKFSKENEIEVKSNLSLD